MTTLTPEQRQAIEGAGDEPVRVEDPVTHATYVLLKAEIYESMREALEDERQQKAFREAGLRSAIRWMKDNPY
jgi:PHD/YefM family antitoxin component YafN of YafNO toxin-antitoxin module